MGCGALGWRLKARGMYKPRVQDDRWPTLSYVHDRSVDQASAVSRMEPSACCGKMPKRWRRDSGGRRKSEAREEFEQPERSETSQMKDLSFEEATALLAHRHICQDMQEWWPDKIQPYLERCASGLVRDDGSRAGLFIELTFARPPKTGLIEFKFTVFRRHLSSVQRVYQMHLNKVARRPKNWHDFAHEHVGASRVDGSPEWLAWSFNDALDYFCRRTNIEFLPPLHDPSVFRLKP